MKKLYFFLLAALTLSLAACHGNDPDKPEGGKYPRKHLIEHFTGEECGYCPYGMESIEEFLASTDKNYIWVSHHYGYGTDEYTIAANSTIGKKLGVQGAPSVVFDRTKRRVDGTSAYSFHPGYLTEKGAVPLNDADSAIANVVIVPSYDAASRELKLTVKGNVLDETIESLRLSVLIKESGMVGKQADYYGSWEGWSEFCHVKTVRAMLSEPMGDVVEVSKGKYSADYTFSVPAKWVAENCMIVAYITEDATTVKPIINAEQTPLVEGTKGGEDFKAEGIKAVPVSETYPEEGAPMDNIEFTAIKINTENLASYGCVVVTLQAPNTKVNAGGYSCYPYMQLYVFTKTATLADGTYPIVQGKYDDGMVAGGYRDDANFELGGSMLYYVFSQSGNLYPMQQWLLDSGELVVDNGNYSITATTRNGSPFTGTYTVPVTAPARNVEAIPTLWKREKMGVCLLDAVR